jgi:hypothetical protein
MSSGPRYPPPSTRDGPGGAETSVHYQETMRGSSSTISWQIDIPSQPSEYMRDHRRGSVSCHLCT